MLTCVLMYLPPGSSFVDMYPYVLASGKLIAFYKCYQMASVDFLSGGGSEDQEEGPFLQTDKLMHRELERFAGIAWQTG